MPTVPGADSFQTVNATAPGAPIQQANYKEMMSDVNQSAAEGAKAGNTLQQIGGSLGQQAIATQTMDNEASAKKALSDAQGRVNAILTTPKTGFLNQVGGDAVAQQKDVSSIINALPEATLNGLANDNQRAMIRDHLSSIARNATLQINNHTSAQSVVFNKAADLSTVNTFGTSAAVGLIPADIPHALGSAPPANAATKEQIASFGTNPDGTTAFGNRGDGTPKGSGFLGVLKVPGTDAVASEYSVGMTLKGKDGNPVEVDIPSLVPTLTASERKEVLQNAADGKMPSDAILAKASAFAQARIDQGKSPFAGADESPAAGNVTPTPDVVPSTPYQTGLAMARAHAESYANMTIGHGTDDTSVALRGQLVDNMMAEKVYAPTLDRLLHGGSGQAMSTLDPASLNLAKAYYNNVKSALPGAARTQYESTFDAAEGSATALSTAFTAMQLHPGNIDAQAGYLQKQFQSGAINKTTYDAALSEASQRYSLHNAQVNESTKSVLGNLWGQIQDAKKNGTVFTENMIPPGTLAFIKSQNLGPNVDSMFSHSEGTDNPKLFMDLMSMSQEHPVQFMAMGSGGIAKLQGSLSGQNFNALVNTYNGINNKDVQQQTTDKLMFTTLKYAADQINPAAKLVGAGFTTDPKEGSPAAAQLAVFQVQLLQNLRAAAERNKAPLNGDQAKGIALGMLKDQALAGTGYFGSPMGLSHTSPFQMTPEQRTADWVIPQTEGAAILKSYQSAHGGKSPSNAEMQQRYKMRQGMYQ